MPEFIFPHSRYRRLVGRALVLTLLTLGCDLAVPAQERSELTLLFKVHKVKKGIIKHPSGLLRHPYLVPSGPYFQLFDWDSYFMGVALSYDGASAAPLKNSVEDFLELVGRNADDEGYIPREIAPHGLWALPEMCKPFLAQSAYRASLSEGSAEWLRPWYKKLEETLRFWENDRQSADGFFLWYNGVESGVDNNPAVADRPAQVTEGVDLQCYLYREYRAMALLAGKLGFDQDAKDYQRKADDLTRKIRDGMWSERDGMFLNINARTGKPIRVETWTNFIPLWVEVATPGQAKRMIEDHLLNPKELWARYGVRTLAPGEPLYDPKAGYWRGPVWVISSYLMMHGLMNYGYSKQATQLAEETVQLLVQDLKATGGMNECYNPDDGRPLAGGHFVSWDLLGEHMVEEAKRALDPTALKPF